MNSTTGDFSEVRKSCLTDELYTRGTQSCVKKKPYLPRNLINLRPLNLNGIKKEFEESYEDQERHENHSSELNSSSVDEDSESSSACVKESTEYPITNKSNYVEFDHRLIESEKQQKLVPSLSDNNSERLYIRPEEKEHRFVNCHRKNDSFNLNFSDLSLETPVKEKESSTPSTNNSLNSIKSAHTRKKQFDEFVTPKVNINSTHDWSSENPYLKTPVNLLNNKRPYTPLVINKPIYSQKILPNLTSENRFTCTNEETTEIVKNKENPLVLSSSVDDNILKKIVVKNVKYIVLNLLGKGGSSVVFHCYNVENKCHVAIKCVSLQNTTSASSYINEVKLLQQLQNCEKIIKMYDFEIVDSQKLLVVLEKGGEDLSTILKHLATQQSHIPMYMLIFYWMEMLYAVKQIHMRGIIHSDLKPANFLKADGGLKLIDFGIASSVQTDMTSIIKSVPEGSCNYISPEALNSDSAAKPEDQSSCNPESCAKYKVHYKSDIWSLGCILYQLVYRRTPFQHITHLWSKLAAIMNPNYKIEYPDADWVSPRIIHTIQRCLQYNVKSRPTVDELIVEYENSLHNI